METTHQGFFEKVNNWMKNSITLRLFVIGFLMLILLIPASMIQSLIYERQSKSDEAANEISSKWGEKQVLTGPIICVPFNRLTKLENNQWTKVRDFAYFLPEVLNIKGQLKPEIRYRGIYKTVVYGSDITIDGNFIQPDFAGWKTTDEDIFWNEAFIMLGISDMKGIKNIINMKWNDSTIALNPGIEAKELLASGVSAPIMLQNTDSNLHHFSFTIQLNGSKDLSFIPLGKETRLLLNSDWGNPSFSGAFLPDKRDISDNNFSAEWKVLHLNRNFPQKWQGTQYSLNESAFGVSLLLPVDEYQKNFRAAKYAIINIVLTFLVFFFMEILNKKRIHPIQYLLAGLALLLFYTLLLSLSEQMMFNYAYLITALAIGLLISIYSISIFQKMKLTIITGLLLFLMYGFIFVIIQLQDMALLVGSIGLFIVLAMVMYISRKVNWYNFNSTES
ncbi:MAG: cell envelope integrity protein CreD [Bacteroidota bacterium]